MILIAAAAAWPVVPPTGGASSAVAPRGGTGAAAGIFVATASSCAIADAEGGLSPGGTEGRAAAGDGASTLVGLKVAMRGEV